MAIHTLITGANGAGKTLYAVSKIAVPLIGTELEMEDGTRVKRRLVNGGVRDLLVDHELMDVPKWDPERESSPYAELKREPGDAPLEVVHTATNWWAWCMPGDVIVIDECQRLFRPMASGRKVPMFIEKLETARHYGVEFVYITQHPGLLHANVRNLIGEHKHIRRAFGFARCIVYTWDHQHDPKQPKGAVVGMWKHDKKAFELYKSAELHTKHAHAVPLAMWLGLAAIVALPFVGWKAYASVHRTMAGSAAAASAPAAAASGGERSKQAQAVAAASSPASGTLEVKDIPKQFWLGCMVMGARCSCLTYAGTIVPTDHEWCVRSSREYGAAIPYPIQPLAPAEGAGPLSGVAKAIDNVTHPAGAVVAQAEHNAPALSLGNGSIKDPLPSSAIRR